MKGTVAMPAPTRTRPRVLWICLACMTADGYDVVPTAPSCTMLATPLGLTRRRRPWQSHSGQDAGGGDGRGAAHRLSVAGAVLASVTIFSLAMVLCDRARRDAVRDRSGPGRVRGRRGRAVDHRAGIRVLRAAAAQCKYRGGLRRHRIGGAASAVVAATVVPAFGFRWSSWWAVWLRW